jgi:2-C-methyl-D-erythritol 2,4-cyclodiphosphate synthase
MHVGIGYDVHKFTDGKSLILGGVEIPHTKKLDGWSDADALVHAIIDALLGAAALGDIGSHFPSGDPKYKDISSLILLDRIKDELSNKGWRIINIDVTVMAEQPLLKDYIDTMRNKISKTLCINREQVNVKAETSDTIGYVGRGQGIGCLAVALIEGGNDEDI